MPSQFLDEYGRPIRPGGTNAGSIVSREEPPRWDIQRRKWPQAPKVVHVVLTLDVGGLERLVVDLVREGLRLGQKPAVICLEEAGELAPQVEVMSVEVHCLYKTPGIRPAVVGQLAKLFRKIQPDVIHTHQVGALFYAGAAARRYGKIAKCKMQNANRKLEEERADGTRSVPATIPHPSPLPEGEGISDTRLPTAKPQPRGWPVVIHTEHGKHYAQRRRTRWLGKWAGRYADKFCCVSEDIAEEVRRLRVVPGVKIEVVANGVDVGRFRKASGVRHQASGAQKKTASADGAILVSPGRNPGEAASAEGAILDSPGRNPGDAKAEGGRQKAEDNRNHKSVVIGTIGRLAEIKRQDVLIRAFARLAATYASAGRPHPSPLPKGEGIAANPKSKIQNPKSEAPHPSPLPEGEGMVGDAHPTLTPDACRLTPSPPTPSPPTPSPPTPSPPTPSPPTPDACLLIPSLLLVGAGPERENLEKLAEELGVSDRVQFAGYQAEPERWLAQMDVFALTSRSEGMPVSILEAWAAGVPVVASAVGGVPELVVDGETGLLFPSGDDAALAACFERLLTDRELVERLAAAGRERVEREFSLARMAERYQQIYREVYERELAIEETR